ncbi:uncharacterized protein BKA78DRAFT_303592 [Phyllosticta capitalensis]|uniref:uncharacterized protein n=1 Tax=Phyllosticta capitalensis TaxID=121624 RepID=UPI00312DB5E0
MKGLLALLRNRFTALSGCHCQNPESRFLSQISPSYRKLSIWTLHSYLATICYSILKVFSNLQCLLNKAIVARRSMRFWT